MTYTCFKLIFEPGALGDSPFYEAALGSGLQQSQPVPFLLFPDPKFPKIGSTGPGGPSVAGGPGTPGTPSAPGGPGGGPGDGGPGGGPGGTGGDLGLLKSKKINKFMQSIPATPLQIFQKRKKKTTGQKEKFKKTSPFSDSEYFLENLQIFLPQKVRWPKILDTYWQSEQTEYFLKICHSELNKRQQRF